MKDGKKGLFCGYRQQKKGYEGEYGSTGQWDRGTSDREKTKALCLFATKLVRGKEAEKNGFAQP